MLRWHPCPRFDLEFLFFPHLTKDKMIASFLTIFFLLPPEGSRPHLAVLLELYAHLDQRVTPNASYKLGQRRWKNGDCDNSAKDWACVSLSSASTVSQRAALAR